jgi:hypothetical protein
MQEADMANHSLLACLAAIKAKSGQFYVYVLYRPDGRPFYVGCARAGRSKWGERLRDHEDEARLGRRSLKHSIIRKILRIGNKVSYIIDSWHDDRDAMVAREIELIAKIGRRQLGKGPLANRTDGGGGGAGAVMSAASRRLMSSQRKGRKATEETRERLRIAKAKSRAVLSERQRQNWADPDYRARVTKNMSGKSLPVETKEKLRLTTATSWANPEIAAKRKAGLAISLNKPEYRKQKAQRMLELWQDPAFRERMMEARRIARAVRSQLTLNLTGD